ncbi:uncharacterized protein LOC132055759 isoform X1 [Lycium ferocissimum]|uniref:uncharacterized protein LOC132055759 isoform X1 n=1 Tax=Lycium ferocissimum TaxID=112874 RepID=UPI0028161BC4|nr:uncharacterized protein LOC132055759 isoform X1 [Lycium ferocissimum]XP_059303713.1 uncharacterized protein LOC132055759 isoform X1 [Lycium ferocissimum]XP_059303714.1 uncharacterized protein LOC132055759 isoform X1 [Lycium ferocissimum]XP_059303715.1 uncharacterized protein LOC132055759 isoform X1 [Lycium ferocissimum]XP_059303716.1 uncharacterized protein LOC132055759 isoform X1 [Lycium ferocissimum]
MATLHDDIIQMSSAMEPKHVTATDGKSGTPHSLAVTGVKVSPRGKTLSSSDSSCNTSPDSTLNDPFGKADYESDDYTANTNNLPKLDKDNKSRFSENQRPVSGSSTISSERLNHEVSPSMSQSEVTQYSSRLSSGDSSTTDSPPVQVMENSANKSYRIPSSVFAIDESANPADWSTASHESLFSIHMGTMSFTKDASFWQSGELGTPQNFSKSPMCDFSPYQSSPEMEIAEVEVSRGNEDLNHERPLAEGRICHKSMESGTSTTSFAFPELEGNLDKNYSVRMAAPIKSSPEQKQPQVESPELKRPQVESPELHTEPLPQSEPKTPTATENVEKTKWFPCFSCCSFGS